MNDLLLTVLLQYCQDVPGDWNAFCPGAGVATQGTSIEHATKMVQEAILISLAENGRNPLPPKENPQVWKVIRQVMREGKPLATKPLVNSIVLSVLVRGTETEVLPWEGYVAL